MWVAAFAVCAPRTARLILFSPVPRGHEPGSRAVPVRALHLLKPVRERAADRERLGAPAQLKRQPAGKVAPGALDRAEIDDGVAVDLPEVFRRELLEEILERSALGGLRRPDLDAVVARAAAALTRSRRPGPATSTACSAR